MGKIKETVNLSDSIDTFRIKVNTISDDVGSTIDLNTEETNTIVGAINELDDDINGPSGGDPTTDLTTTGKNLVSAINEHDAELGLITAAAMGTDNGGGASTVSTAINELDGRLDYIRDVELITPRLTSTDANGTSTFNGSVQIDKDLDVTGNFGLTGNATIGGNIGLTGNITIGGTSNVGDANTDNVVFAADINSNIIPNTDNAYDLGSSTKEWRNLYIDGTAKVDTLTVDENATVAGTLGVTGVTTLTGAVSLGTAALESFQDYVGAMVSGNSESGLAVTYDDTNGKLDFNVNDPTITLTGGVTGSATMTNLGNVTINTVFSAGSINLGTDTTGNYMSNIVGTANEVEVTHTAGEGSSATIGLPADVVITNSLNVQGQVEVAGDFVITGEARVAETSIRLIAGHVGPAVDSASLIVERGDSQDAQFIWDEVNHYWRLSTSDAAATTSRVAAYNSFNTTDFNNTGSTISLKASRIENIIGNKFEDVNVTDTNSGYTWAETGTISASSLTDGLTFVSGDGININIDAETKAILIENKLKIYDKDGTLVFP